jgi:hypothetical protein
MAPPELGRNRAILPALTIALVLYAPAPASAQVTAAYGPPIEVMHIDGEIRVDGALDDPVWNAVPRIDGWLETNPGDNLPASVGCSARIAYDGEFLYAAFEFDDPDPRAIRAPLGDRDNVPSSTDYGGIILDARNDGKTAQMFLANARGIQYDAITSDASGEDNSPDFFWEAAGRSTARGWQLEMRIPFSSIRYVGSNPQQWGILLYRNRPRDFRYQYFSSRLPRDRPCFVCNGRPVVGLHDLPSGSHWVVAPYASASQGARPQGDLGSPLRWDDAKYEGGADLKWLPNPETVVDAAINPDFSQIESDEGKITANERFAIYQPEKRPFFLESVDLFSTPITAVYTRSFTDPRWGGRATGGSETMKYTVLVGQDQGGGSVVLPGPRDSHSAHQDFPSWVALGRIRKDLGLSSLSLLYSGREIEGGGSNRVLGPDFQWRPNEQSTLTGQLLWSASKTPDRPALASQWDGRELNGHAAEVWYSWANRRFDFFGVYDDVANDFRADNGFVPRVGYRSGRIDTGRTLRPKSGPVRRLRLFLQGEASDDRDGVTLTRWIGPGFGMDALWNSFVRVEFNRDEVRGQENLHQRFFVAPQLEIRPGKIINDLIMSGSFGDQIDFDNDRDATGGDLQASVDLRPTDRLRVTMSYRRRWLNVDAGTAGKGRLFTAKIPRVRAVYTFSSRAWLRLIGEWSDVDFRPELWTFAVDPKSGDFGGSAVFAYKLNWQTVLFLGYSDARSLDDGGVMRPAEKQGFFKLSYAFRG